MENRVPILRFSEFIDSWKYIKYHELYTFKTTNSYSRDKLNYGSGEIKNIHYGDIHTKFNSILNISTEEVPFINEDVDTSKIHTESYIENGDLVIADASENYEDVGKTIEVQNLQNEKVVAGLHTFLARRISDKICVGFAPYLMQTYGVRFEVMKIAQGTKVLGISKNRLKDIQLVLPSILEQQKIASFLSSVDKRIQLLQEKKEKFEAYKKGVMQQLFSQEIRFRDDKVNEFPDWEEKTLGELTLKVGKKNKDNLDLPVYSINNKEGFLPQSEQFEGVNSKKRGFDISMYKIINKKTFAYNPARINVGSIGYSGGLENIIISSLYVCFQTKENLDDAYLGQYLTTFIFNKAVKRNVEGGVREYLFYENFSRIKVPLPSVQEQKKIAEFLVSIDNFINKVGEQIEEMNQFKKGLLQQMFV